MEKNISIKLKNILKILVVVIVLIFAIWSYFTSNNSIDENAEEIDDISYEAEDLILEESTTGNVKISENKKEDIFSNYQQKNYQSKFVTKPYVDKNETYDVVRIVDGDTIVVKKSGGKNIKVRMIGVNTPESVALDDSRNVPEGKTVSDYTKNLLEGKKVVLEYDEEKLDQYGRTLAYVYLEGESFMVNYDLLEKGYARVMLYAPNYKYMDEVYELQNYAKKNKLGFWGTGYYGSSRETR